MAIQLNGFRGDLKWVHEREGHKGTAYWAAGDSGVTLDPGIDLGYADAALIEKCFKPLLTPQQYEAVKTVLGLKGEAARSALTASPVLSTIQISKQQAEGLLDHAFGKYWDAIVTRFPNLVAPDALAAAQTAMLSLAYNRGPNNKNLEVLAVPIQQKNWAELANCIGAMQQDHKLMGIRKRRTMEADLIRTGLAA